MEITDRLYGRLAGDEVKNTIAKLKPEGELAGIDETLYEFQELLEWYMDNKRN